MIPVASPSCSATVHAHSVNKLLHSTKFKLALHYSLHFAHREGLNHTGHIVSFTREHVIKKRQMIG